MNSLVPRRDSHLKPRERERNPAAQSFSTLLWQSCAEVTNPYATIGAALLGLVLLFYAPTTMIEGRWVMAGAAVWAYLTAILFRATWNGWDRANQQALLRLPSVLTSVPVPARLSAFALLILEPSELFGYDIVVGIYTLQDDVERFVGHGIVWHIQEDKKIQVLVLSNADETDLWEQITQKNKDALSALRIRPTLPASVLSLRPTYRITEE